MLVTATVALRIVAVPVVAPIVRVVATPATVAEVAAPRTEVKISWKFSKLLKTQ